MGNQKFTLRALQPSDGPGVASLITEFDGDMTTHFQVDPYTAIVSGTEYRTTGVVAECAGYDGLVGMGTLRFGSVQYNGDVLPLAFLDGLKVHKDFRGNGLGDQIADWRYQRAREALGDDGVIATGMLYDNHASHAVAKKWCREFLESALVTMIVPMRSRPPASLAGISVRDLDPREYDEFADKRNAFHRQHNLHPPCDAGSIAGALAVSAEGQKPYRFFVAMDTRGNLLAGAQTWARGLLKSDTINNLPASLRVMNRALHLLPGDLTIRDIACSGLWYEAGELKAARFLWEMIRWECRDQGTTLVAAFDPRDGAQEAVALKPWHQPRPRITIAIHGPAAINREKLVFGLGRV